MVIPDPKLLLGTAIRKEREKQGISQEKFAHQCGLHRTYISSVEGGERNISLESVLRIAATLGVTLSELFSKARL
jgi:transcriptional regulator with XRE-family HTH domain